MKRRFFTLLFLSLVLANLSAQVDVQRVSASSFTDAQGFVYKLPKTRLIIEVQAERTVSKAGPYHLFAERYLGVTDAIMQDSDTWTLQSVTVRAQGVPDNDKTFKIITDAASSTMVVQLTRDGIISAINQQVEQPPFEIINTPIVAPNLNFNMAVLSQDALLASTTSKMAEIAARQIMSIRENRTDILIGEAGNIPDGAAMQILLAEMERNERDLRELFIGKTVLQSITRSFEITPENDTENEILFRFSQRRGFVDKDDFGGAPVHINLVAERKTMEPSKASRRRNGIFYTIPGAAQVEITSGGKTFYRGEFQMAQFGVEQSLAPNLFNRNVNHSLIFDTGTGAITQMLK